MGGTRIQVHKAAVAGLFAPPDGRGPLLSAAADMTIAVIDPVQGTVIKSLERHEARVSQVLFAQDEVVTASQAEARIWRRSDWSPVARIAASDPIALHPHGAVLSPADGVGAVKLVIYRLDGTLLHDYLVEFYATQLVARSDGVSFGCCHDGDLHVWDTRKLTARPLVKYSLPAPPGGISAIHATDDGRRVVLRGEKVVHVWQLREDWFEEGDTTKKWGQKTKWKMKEPDHGADCSSFTWKGKPDAEIRAAGVVQSVLLPGERVVLAGKSGIAIHALADGKKLQGLVGATFPTDEIAVDAAGKRLAAVSGKSAGVWDIESGKRLVTHEIAKGRDESLPAMLALKMSVRGCVVVGDTLAVADASGGVTLVPIP